MSRATRLVRSTTHRSPISNAVRERWPRSGTRLAHKGNTSAITNPQKSPLRSVRPYALLPSARSGHDAGVTASGVIGQRSVGDRRGWIEAAAVVKADIASASYHAAIRLRVETVTRARPPRIWTTT